MSLPDLQPPAMPTNVSRAWRPTLPGWSDDILPFYAQAAAALGPTDAWVELGVAWGRSIVYLASELVRLKKPGVTLWAVDPWQGEGEIHGERLPYSLRRLVDKATDEELALIHPLRLTSERASGLFERESVAGVFVDAAHDYESVARDLEMWWDAVAVGGVLAGHDYHSRDWPGVVSAVDEFCGLAHVRMTVYGTVWCVRK
jgi:methyltransferase family protein